MKFRNSSNSLLSNMSFRPRVKQITNQSSFATPAKKSLSQFLPPKAMEAIIEVGADIESQCESTIEDETSPEMPSIEPNGSEMDADDIQSDDELDEEEDFRLHIKDFAASCGTQTAKALFAIEIRKLEKKERPLKKQKK